MRVSALCSLGAVLGAIVAVFGCSKDESTPVARVSQKGEACQVTNDCATGLACMPVPGGAIGVCTVGTFKIAQVAKECAVTECSTPADCCALPSATCTNLLTQCNADAGTSSTIACQQYDQQCKCDTTKVDCEQNKCVSKCNTDTECMGGGTGRKCAGGKCVQCASDNDCSSGMQCVSGSCQPPCQTDGDCAGFDRCIAGKCVDSGCQTDRECVAATRNVEATCGTDQKCIVPCQTDLECGNPKSYSFFSCISNQCVYTGCQSDKDCRLMLTGPSDAGAQLSAKQHVICREKTTPGNVTRPAF